jgi:hypothetical protein
MSGYLVQLSPGREFLYRTPWEFRAAIHSGEITEVARIYHHASESWISIRMHPEFRRFEAEREQPHWSDAGTDEIETYPRPPALRRRVKPSLIHRLQHSLRRVLASLTAPPQAPENQHSSREPEPPPPRPAPVTRPPRPADTPARPSRPSKPNDQGSRNRWTFY